MDHFLKEEIRGMSEGGRKGAAPAQGGPPIKKPVDIKFEKISYEVELGFRKGRKKILHDVSGRFPARQLVAILGPSGAGKSSLLDVLSGFRTRGVGGSVVVRGRVRELAAFRRDARYIAQDDRLQPLLTVAESMRIAAGLKLGARITQQHKQQLIEDILSTLGLTSTQDTQCALLSGGQKKRVSIALELVDNPLVMFLDEPTTGLDSSSCRQVVLLLKQLARQGRTVVCTVHQPPASLFTLFDQVYVLAAGRCLYQGAPDQLVPFLATVGLHCPVFHNPADLVIELACGEFGWDKVDRMVDGVDNGGVTKWMAADLHVDNTPQGGSSGRASGRASSTSTSSWLQISLLLQRGFIKMRRDATLTHLRLAVNLLVGLMLGAIYVNSGNQGDRIMDNYALLFGILMHHVMSTMMLTILTFPSEMSILKKEHFNRWYSLKSYYISVSIVDIPISVASCLIFSLVVYFLSGQPHDATRFSMFFTISTLTVFVAQSVGLMVGATFNVVNGTFLGPTLCVPMMMFAGFGVSLRDLPAYLKWGSYVSYLRYGLEGYVAAIYGSGRATLACADHAYCHFKYPGKFLEEIAMRGDQFWTDVTALACILVICRVAAYALLRWRLSAGR